MKTIKKFALKSIKFTGEQVLRFVSCFMDQRMPAGVSYEFQHSNHFELEHNRKLNIDRLNRE